MARRRAGFWTQRNRLPLEKRLVEEERDKATIDAIREIFGMGPLYAEDRELGKLQGERFGGRVYHVVRGPSGLRYELGP